MIMFRLSPLWYVIVFCFIVVVIVAFDVSTVLILTLLIIIQFFTINIPAGSSGRAV